MGKSGKSPSPTPANTSPIQLLPYFSTDCAGPSRYRNSLSIWLLFKCMLLRQNFRRGKESVVIFKSQIHTPKPCWDMLFLSFLVPLSENQRSSSITYRVVLAKSLIALSLNLFTWKLQDALIDSKTFASSEMATYQWQDTAVPYLFLPRKEPSQNWEVAGKILNHT